MKAEEVIDRIRGIIIAEFGEANKEFEKYDVEIIKRMKEINFLLGLSSKMSILENVSRSYLEGRAEEQRYRFAFLREYVCKGFSLIDDRKWIYCDGEKVEYVFPHEANKIYSDTLREFGKELSLKYPMEYLACDRPIDLIIPSSTQSYLDEVFQYARDLGESSLIRCLNRLQHYSRCSLNHEIILYQDHCKYSFYFVEIVDGNRWTNGGIIYDETRKKWEIHT